MSVNPSLPMRFAQAGMAPGADHYIDISDKVCPMTFVHTRLALDRLAPGQVLAVRLRGDEPIRNVPRTSEEQGHEVLGVTHEVGGEATVLIRKKAGSRAG